MKIKFILLLYPIFLLINNVKKVSLMIHHLKLILFVMFLHQVILYDTNVE